MLLYLDLYQKYHDQESNGVTKHPGFLEAYSYSNAPGFGKILMNTPGYFLLSLHVLIPNIIFLRKSSILV